MENQHRFHSEQEVIEWLLGIVNTEEEYESLISDLSCITGETRAHIIERRCMEDGSSNLRN